MSVLICFLSELGRINLRTFLREFGMKPRSPLYFGKGLMSLKTSESVENEWGFVVLNHFGMMVLFLVWELMI